MAMQDLTGHKVPQVRFKIREDDHWVTKTSDDFFRQKKVILFALPGAFTPTCSSVHLPSYNDLAAIFKKNGVDDLICLSVNDSFVLNEWKKKEKAENITMLPDGNGEFTQKMGLLVDKEDLCFGKRSWRYSMYVDDGIIKKMFLEPEEEGDPYGASSAENMLKYLNPQIHLPKSVAIFTRPGCSFCARAKKLLRQKEMDFDELVLNEDFTIKTIKAISGSTQVPQVFINGQRVGGAEDLENYLQKEKGKD
jgi:glutathione-dependent peroxiredoxin